jgi:alpha-L-arabinofuranosidase
VELDDHRDDEPAAGRVGVATFETAAEFKDVTVIRGDDTLMDGDFDAVGGRTSFGGRWSEADGLVKQSESRATGFSLFGDPTWSNYTLRLKARKTAGREGFIIIFRKGEGGSQLQWNLGGWGNTQHGLQRNDGGAESIIEQKPGAIERNRWYDVRIELDGERVKCFLDDELVHSLEAPAPKLPRLFATASRLDGGAVIVKVVNTTGADAEADVQLAGMDDIDLAEATVLAGGPRDENSLDEPEKVKPQTRELEDAESKFTHLFPAYSLTVLRFE